MDPFAGQPVYTGKFPVAWSEVIVIPVFKKGDRGDPSYYRPISLLSVVGKLCASYLNQKLASWIEDQNILSNEQAGFRKGRSTTDCCIFLSHLAEKYMTSHGNGLITSFIDLKSAFDSVPRDNLWIKLSHTSIGKRLLHLIKSLYQCTTLHVRCGLEGNLKKSISASGGWGGGVHQGGILAPMQLNLYLNYIQLDFHPPGLAETECPLLCMCMQTMLSCYHYQKLALNT